MRPEASAWAALGAIEGTATFVKFSPSMHLVAVAGNTGAVTIWDVASGTQRVLRGHADSIYEVDFSGDEQQLVSASDDGTARLWDLRSGSSHTLRGHQDDVLKARFSPDGQWVATASLDRTVRIWPTRFDESRRLHGHAAGFVGHLAFVGAKDGPARLITQAIGSDVIAWDLATGGGTTLGAPWPGPNFPAWQDVWPAVISRGGQVAAAREAGGIDLWTGGDHRVLGTEGERYHAIAFSPDHKVLVATRAVEQSPPGKGAPEIASTVTWWDLETGASRVIWSAPTSIYALAFSPDGDVLVMLGREGAKLWSPHSERIVAELPAPSDARWTRAAFSQDGRKLALVSRQGSFAVWEPVTGKRSDFNTDKHHILNVTFSPDGELIAAAVADRTVRVWDLVAGGDAAVLTGHTDLVMVAKFSPDGKLIASGAYDRTVRLWKRGSWESRVLYGHTGSVDSVDWSPDGKTLASIARDGTVKLWAAGLDPDPSPIAIERELEAITTAVIGGDAEPQTPQ